jgi:hypothetical protein
MMIIIVPHAAFADYGKITLDFTLDAHIDASHNTSDAQQLSIIALVIVRAAPPSLQYSWHCAKLCGWERLWFLQGGLAAWLRSLLMWNAGCLYGRVL